MRKDSVYQSRNNQWSLGILHLDWSARVHVANPTTLKINYDDNDDDFRVSQNY